MARALSQSRPIFHGQAICAVTQKTTVRETPMLEFMLCCYQLEILNNFFNERLQIFTLHLVSPDSWPTGVGQEKRAHIIQSKMSQKEKNKYIYGSISMESRKMALINLFAGQQWDTDSENWHADPAREGEGKPNWDSSIETQALWNW